MLTLCSTILAALVARALHSVEAGDVVSTGSATCVESRSGDTTCSKVSEGGDTGVGPLVSSVAKIGQDHVLLQRSHDHARIDRISDQNAAGSAGCASGNFSLPFGAAACEPSQIQRRRRASSMCCCRRRSGGSDLRAGLICKNNEIVTCEGSDCPVGWSSTSGSKGSGWCSVSVPEFGWSPLKTCPTGAGATRVKVLTYNLFWWNLFGRRGGEDGRAGRMIAHTSSPEEYDLIGFQECDDIGRVMNDAKRHGLSGEYGSVGPHKAIALAYRKSRWSMIDSGTAEVGEDSRRQYYGKRSVIWARLLHRDGSTVFFINHHGPLPVSESGGCTGSATAYNILKVIAENARSSDTVILVGDFNAQPHSSRIRALDKHIHRVMSGTSMGSVDHIFSNCAGSAVLSKANIGTGGSDHDALNAVFAIPRPASIKISTEEVSD